MQNKHMAHLLDKLHKIIGPNDWLQVTETLGRVPVREALIHMLDLRDLPASSLFQISVLTTSHALLIRHLGETL